MSRHQLGPPFGEVRVHSRKRSSDASQVRHDVRELVRITDTLLGFPDVQESAATYDELYTVFRLSGDIAFNLGKLAATAKKEEKHPTKIRKTKAHLPCPSEFDFSQDALSQLICHKCETVNTPKWRAGPDGPCTLCNVCGLVYAKRKRRGDYQLH
ncbi:Gata transcription factor [Paramyrothecium foliicola]|nr:Gata transcription factor [Paramyrothecium foliicola]